MIHKLLILGGVLAVAGAAQAQSVNVAITGKSPHQVRAELYDAAVQTCRSDADPLDPAMDECVSDTYSRALSQARRYWSRTAAQARVASR